VTTENQEKDSRMKEKIIEVIKTCYDPEIPVNIYELGLIYDVDIDADNNVLVKMTLTSPACPVAGILPGEVEDKIRALPETNDVKVEVVWDPPWNPDMMSDVARYELGMM
jgi:FeS assembly SUF system protein